MYKVIRSGEIQPTPGGTVSFEGEPYGSGVSFFLVKNIGTERLEIICVHSSPRMIQVELE